MKRKKMERRPVGNKRERGEEDKTLLEPPKLVGLERTLFEKLDLKHWKDVMPYITRDSDFISIVKYELIGTMKYGGGIPHKLNKIGKK